MTLSECLVIELSRPSMLHYTCSVHTFYAYCTWCVTIHTTVVTIHTLYMRFGPFAQNMQFPQTWLSCLSMCFLTGPELHSKATLYKPVDQMYPRGYISCLHHRRKSQSSFFAGLIASAASRSGPTLQAKTLIRQTQSAGVTA